MRSVQNLDAGILQALTAYGISKGAGAEAAAAAAASLLADGREIVRASLRASDDPDDALKALKNWYSAL